MSIGSSLSTIEKQRIERAAMESHPMDRSVELAIDLAPIYRASARGGTLFTTNLPGSFEELWSQAETLYAGIQRKKKKAKEEI